MKHPGRRHVKHSLQKTSDHISRADFLFKVTSAACATRKSVREGNKNEPKPDFLNWVNWSPRPKWWLRRSVWLRLRHSSPRHLEAMTERQGEPTPHRASAATATLVSGRHTSTAAVRHCLSCTKTASEAGQCHSDKTKQARGV